MHTDKYTELETQALLATRSSHMMAAEVMKRAAPLEKNPFYFPLNHTFGLVYNDHGSWIMGC